MRYYRFVVKGNDKVGGVLYSPKNWPYPIAIKMKKLDLGLDFMQIYCGNSI